MIVKKSQVKIRNFKGVDFELLATGLTSMITKMLYNQGTVVPMHNHPHEQSGYVLSGKIRIKFADFDEVLTEGDSYSIPGNEMHGIEVLENARVLDVFTPIREDYL